MLSQGFDANGFEQTLGHADIKAVLNDLRLGMGGETENRVGAQSLGLLDAAHLPGELITVHLRHVAVGDGQVERWISLLPFGQCRLTVIAGDRAVAQVFDLLTEQQAIRCVVLDHQNVQALIGWAGGRDRC
ncbi:hypothetical protein D3C71_1500980 [compost metagenome]